MPPKLILLIVNIMLGIIRSGSQVSLTVHVTTFSPVYGNKKGRLHISVKTVAAHVKIMIIIIMRKCIIPDALKAGRIYLTAATQPTVDVVAVRKRCSPSLAFVPGRGCSVFARFPV